MVRAGIVGGTGYTGVELLRLLAQHPQVELRAITSRKEAGTAVSAMFPSLRRHVDLAFSEPKADALRGCDVVFFATPSGVAMAEARALLESGARVIDLSADFRIKDVAEWERWYKLKHAAPELVAEAVYGLPELNRERLAGARLVANPGCYPTATQLALLPLVEAGIVDLDHLIAFETADDVFDMFCVIYTNGKITGDKVGPHSDLLDEFPYLGPPHAALK